MYTFVPIGCQDTARATAKKAADQKWLNCDEEDLLLKLIFFSKLKK